MPHTRTKRRKVANHSSTATQDKDVRIWLQDVYTCTKYTLATLDNLGMRVTGLEALADQQGLRDIRTSTNTRIGMLHDYLKGLHESLDEIYIRLSAIENGDSLKRPMNWRAKEGA